MTFPSDYPHCEDALTAVGVRMVDMRSGRVVVVGPRGAVDARPCRPTGRAGSRRSQKYPSSQQACANNLKVVFHSCCLLRYACWTQRAMGWIRKIPPMDTMSYLVPVRANERCWISPKQPEMNCVPPGSSEGSGGQSERGCVAARERYMVRIRMTTDLSRFWFTYRTWRTGAGSAA